MRSIILLPALLIIGFTACNNNNSVDPEFNYDKILIVGGFNVSGGSNGKGILRLTKDGNVDTTFNTGALATTTSVRGVSGSNWQARTCYVYPDLNPDGSPNSNAGRILIGGMFDFYNGFSAHKLVKLSANGDYQVGTFNTNINTIIDPTVLQAQQGFNSSPDAIAVQSDGKIIVGGYFGWYNGIYVGGILRLNLDGNLDVSFKN